jgi:hypothetical protein
MSFGELSTAPVAKDGLKLWSRYAQLASWTRVDQVLWVHGIVSVANPPELLWIAKGARGNQIEPVALDNDEFNEQRHGLPLWQEPAAKISEGSSVRGGVSRSAQIVITARGVNHGSRRCT